MNIRHLFRRLWRKQQNNATLAPSHVLTVKSWTVPGKLDRWEYRVGYRKAADALVIKALAEPPPTDQVGLIYPIMYLYRHYLELTLKDLLFEAQAAAVATYSVKVGHDLSTLWDTILDMVETVQGNQDRQSFDEAFGPLVKTFHAADPNADAFRYATNRRGDEHWPAPFNVDIINIKIWIKSFEVWCRMIEEDIEKAMPKMDILRGS